MQHVLIDIPFRLLVNLLVRPYSGQRQYLSPRRITGNARYRACPKAFVSANTFTTGLACTQATMGGLRLHTGMTLVLSHQAGR